MKKQLKRFLSMIFAAVLFAAVLPVDAFAEEAEVTYPLTGSCGQDLTWSLDEMGTLTVSGEGEMTDYTADGGQPWAGYADEVNSLVIEQGVTKLGAFAFDGFAALTTVIFNGSAPVIGQYCFFGTTIEASYTCDGTWTADVLKNYGGTITWNATHTGEEVIDPAVSPTCTETGLAEGKHCSVCGVVLVSQKVVDALGHTEAIDIAVEPTCTETGLTEGSHCSVCAISLKAQTTLPATGHSFGEWTQTKAATCTVDGEEQRVCETCGEVETRAIAAAHSWDEGVITTQPTTELTGIRLYTCTVCGETREETIPALKHGTCGDNLTWVLSLNGTLTISGTGEMKNYTMVPVSHCARAAEKYSCGALFPMEMFTPVSRKA